MTTTNSIRADRDTIRARYAVERDKRLRTATSSTWRWRGSTPTTSTIHTNNEGQQHPHTAQSGSYGGGALEFFQLLADWHAKGDLGGLVLSS